MIPWQTVRLGLGVACGLLAGALLAPREAQASCGDYVLMTGGLTDRSNDSHADPTAPARSKHTPTKGPAPCNGPTCKSSMPLPTPMTATPSGPTSAEQWGWVGGQGDDPDSSGRAALREDSSARPVRRSNGVFHPPR